MIGDARFVRRGVESVVSIRSADAEMVAELVGLAVERRRHRADVRKPAAVIVGRGAVKRVLGNTTVAWKGGGE